MKKEIALLDAPSNLGLRPPAEGVAPGAYKLAGALRDTDLREHLSARDAGVVTPPRYRPEWDGKQLRNAEALDRYTVKLADRVETILKRNELAVVLGGDCSILLGPMLALRRSGRCGLVFLDGHSDFRHLGNSDYVGSAAGEDLALVTGHGDDALPGLRSSSPLVDPRDVVVCGVRDDDPYLAEIVELGMVVLTATDVRKDLRLAAERVQGALAKRGLDRWWVHFDADVMDSVLMPAVDSPVPNGLEFGEAGFLLRSLRHLPGTCGLDVTIYDPDLDEDGELARLLSETIVNALSGCSTPKLAPSRLQGGST